MGFNYFGNASRAKSQGVELSLESRPLRGLTLSAWAAWNEAVLTQGFPASDAAYAVAGSRLPYGSRFSGNVAANDEFPLVAGLTGFVGSSVSYVGERWGVFTNAPQRQNLPAYAKTDLRAGINYDSWTISLFANNVADKRGVVSGGLGTAPNQSAFVFIQPRTLGLNVAKTF